MATQDQPQQSRHGRGDHQTAVRLRRKRVVAIVIMALAFVWLVAFILSNSQTVRVDFVFGHVSVSLIWVMIICAVLGALLAWGISRFSHR